MKNRFLFTVLFATMLAGQAWAYDFQSGDLCYNITSNTTVEVTYQITNSNNYSGLDTITIPEKVTYNGCEYSVKGIGGDAFIYCGLTSVTIPNSVETIGASAFMCSCLTSVNIPNSVKSIDASSFRSCISMESITIPNSVESIGNGAFQQCNGAIYCEAKNLPSGWHNKWNGSIPIRCNRQYNSSAYT